MMMAAFIKQRSEDDVFLYITGEDDKRGGKIAVFLGIKFIYSEIL